MKFTLELMPGATYGELARRLQSICIQIALGENQKPEHGEMQEIREIRECGGLVRARGSVRECGVIVARWSIKK